MQKMHKRLIFHFSSDVTLAFLAKRDEMFPQFIILSWLKLESANYAFEIFFIRDEH